MCTKNNPHVLITRSDCLLLPPPITGGDGGVPLVAWSSSYIISGLLPPVTLASALFTNESVPQKKSRTDADE